LAPLSSFARACLIQAFRERIVFRQSAIGAVPSRPVINISSMGFARQPALALPSPGLRGADQRLAT